MALQEKTEDWLLPYLEGAYAGDAARQAEIEARLAADPALAAEAAQMRRTLDAVRGVAVRTPKPAAAVPADSWPRLKARLQPAPPRRLAWGWLGGAGAAVAVAAGVLAVVLPGPHTPPPASSPPQRTASHSAPTISPAVPSAATTTPKPPQVAQTAPTLTGPLAKPNPDGLSDPFLKLPIPPPLPGASKVPPPPVAIKSVPPPQSKSNPQIASRDITNAPVSPEVVRPLLPLPVPPPLAPAPAAPPLPVSPPVTAPPATPPRFERKMLKVPTPTGQPAPTDAAPAGGQAFGGGTAPAAAPSAPPSTNAFGGGGFGGGAGIGAGGFGGAGGRAMNRMAVPTRREPTSADNAALLTAGTKALAEAVTPPLWGKNEGMQQSNETLTDVREAGLLDDLQTRLEARRAQMPRDLTTGRMLAAVYDFSSTAQAALHERQRVASLDGADGEDFFQLGQSEQRAGNTDAARTAYRRALTAPTPPSGFHAALARQGAQ